MTPLGRIGTPSDIAKIVVFLASDDSGWLTGEGILAAGGLRKSARTKRFRFIKEHPMAACMVFVREKTLDKSELETYWQKTPATLDGPPIKVLAAYGRHVTLEGPTFEGVVIAEFPTLEDARAWYDSPAYQEAMQHRLSGAVYRGLIVEGV
jgi:uncharacterized protein (DUF1330 family)